MAMRKLYFSIIAGVLLVGSFFFWADSSYHRPVASSGDVVRVEIAEGDTAWTIADKLKNKNLIGSKYAFLLGVWRDGLRGTFQAGMYDLGRSLSPADIAQIISSGSAKSRDIKVTFPEGWTAHEMADRLTEKGLPGSAFLALAENPSAELTGQYAFLTHLGDGATLEGYLFPDTYYFLPEASAEDIVKKLLDTFEIKTQSLRESAEKQEKNFAQILTMASIVEGEVRTGADRRVVSGIFWNRLKNEMALQSDATLDYVLQSGKIQHSGKDLETDSPYNTYRYKGLPPGPVGNPSIDSIDAGLYPTASSYVYFLSDPETGKTYFAVTFEEHKRNKEKVGL